MDFLEHDGAEAQVEISLSVDDTNALRAKLGLKPLQMTKTDAEVQAESNFNQLQNEIKRKSNVAEVQKRLERSRNRLKLRGKLVGTTLGSADDAVLDDVSAWTNRQKSSKAHLTARYDDEDTTNVTASGVVPDVGIAHDFDQALTEGSQMILTLMDKNVLDEDEQDILENVDLRNAEKTQQSVDNRKLMSGFSDDLEQVTMGRHAPRSILSHYDHLVDGQDVARANAPHYTLGADGIRAVNNTKAPEELLNAKTMSLEYEKQRIVDDFKSAKEVSIKKSNKRRKTAKLRSQLTDTDGMMVADDENLATNRDRDVNTTYSFVDDEELQSVLATTRQRSLKRFLPPTVDEVKQELAENGLTHQSPDESETGLVFDEISEFVRGLDTVGILSSVKEEPVDQDVEMDETPTTVETKADEEPSEESQNPLVDEVAVDAGLASALEFFRKRGDLDEKDDSMIAREREYRDREKWEVHNMVAINNGATGRETSKAALKRRAETHADRLKNYKPNVNIEYFDERGQQLSTKDAFKELSHKFHGRGPGKNKIEKMMRKEEEKRRQLSMASGDRASELTQVMMDRQKLLGTAAIQLTEGNRPVSAGPTLVGSSINSHSKSNKLQRRN